MTPRAKRTAGTETMEKQELSSRRDEATTRVPGRERRKGDHCAAPEGSPLREPRLDLTDEGARGCGLWVSVDQALTGQRRKNTEEGIGGWRWGAANGE